MAEPLPDDARWRSCEYKPPAWVVNYACPHEPPPGHDLCVCHRAERTPEEMEQFHTIVGEMMARHDYRFVGFQFPPGFQWRRETRTPPTFSGSVDFVDAHFAGDAWFHRATIHGDVRFSGATIQGAASFTRATVWGDTRFDGATVHGDVRFDRAAIEGRARFDRATIEGDAWFEGARIQGNAQFGGATIEGDARFAEATIQGDASFQTTRFLGPVDFQRASFADSVDFRGATVPPAGAFEGIHAADGKGASLFRFAKQVCQHMGRYQEAGDWHVLEFEHARPQRRKGWREGVSEWLLKNPLSKAIRLDRPKWAHTIAGALAGAVSRVCWLIDWLVGDKVFGYGEKPLRVLRAWAVVVVGCWVLYALGRANLERSAGPRTPTVWDALYFSVVTFTTLGFGDWHPATFWPIGLLAMSEALAGTFLMALFVVGLARRWGRG